MKDAQELYQFFARVRGGGVSGLCFEVMVSWLWFQVSDKYALYVAHMKHGCNQETKISEVYQRYHKCLPNKVVESILL